MLTNNEIIPKIGQIGTKTCLHNTCYATHRLFQCLDCGKPIEWPRKDFCSRRCGQRYWARTHGQSRKHYTNHSEEIKTQAKEHYEANKDKYFAHSYLRSKVANGRIKKPSICSFCQSNLHIEGHHADYSKPYDVIWLCRSCHKKLHAEQGGK